MFVTRKAYEALKAERDALAAKQVSMLQMILSATKQATKWEERYHELVQSRFAPPKPSVPPEPTPEQRAVAHTVDTFAANFRAEVKRERPDLSDAQLDAIAAQVRDEIGGFRIPVTGDLTT